MGKNTPHQSVSKEKESLSKGESKTSRNQPGEKLKEEGSLSLTQREGKKTESQNKVSEQESKTKSASAKLSKGVTDKTDSERDRTTSQKSGSSDGQDHHSDLSTTDQRNRALVSSNDAQTPKQGQDKGDKSGQRKDIDGATIDGKNTKEKDMAEKVDMDEKVYQDATTILALQENRKIDDNISVFDIVRPTEEQVEKDLIAVLGEDIVPKIRPQTAAKAAAESTTGVDKAVSDTSSTTNKKQTDVQKRPSRSAKLAATKSSKVRKKSVPQRRKSKATTGKARHKTAEKSPSQTKNTKKAPAQTKTAKKAQTA